MAVSVIIPALDEASCIAMAIDAAFLSGAAEVIVADGGSVDDTIAIAQTHGARVVTGERLRAAQINRGIAAAAHDRIVIVHADTLLPFGAAAAIEEALRNGAHFGGFRVAFLEGGLRLAWVAFAINLRTRLTRKPWGDQAQFARRDTLLRAGGYPHFPIMEDYELARRMKREGDVAFLPLAVRTSGRRFLKHGVFRTAMINWWIIAAYHLGIAPERLARWYRG